MEEGAIREDRIGFGGLVVLQDEGFRYGIDAVLLAAFAAGETGAAGIRCTEGEGIPVRVADLGSGNGIVPFILSHKLPQSRITGFEMQERAYRLALEGSRLNGLTDRIDFVLTDILNLGVNDTGLFLAGYTDTGEGAGIAKLSCEPFDAVVTNPPYFRKGGAIGSGDSSKRIARHETTAELHDFLRCASMMLSHGGHFYIVYRPSRLTDLLAGMRANRIEPKDLQMVVPRAGEAANIVLVHGVKGGGAELRVLPEIPVHGDGAAYTDIIERIYERV